LLSRREKPASGMSPLFLCHCAAPLSRLGRNPRPDTDWARSFRTWASRCLDTFLSLAGPRQVAAPAWAASPARGHLAFRLEAKGPGAGGRLFRHLRVRDGRPIGKQARTGAGNLASEVGDWQRWSPLLLTTAFLETWQGESSTLG
jgi:hypothetical protein